MADANAADHIVVLLGAGASVDAGLPATSDLHARFCDELDPLYANIASLLYPDGDVDVEELFRTIEFIHSVETKSRPDEQRSVHESVIIARLVKNWVDPLQEYFDIQQNAVYGTPTGELIDGLRKALIELLWLPINVDHDLSYLRDLFLGMKGKTICTLNYDNAIERALTVGLTSQIDPGPYPIDRNYELTSVAAPEDTVRLIKLHGSLNWRAGSDGAVEVDYQREMNDSYPAIIFGAGNKLRPTGPFLDLYVEFKVALSRAKTVIVIGYGFRDLHVNELLRRWIQSSREAGRLLRISRLSECDLPDVVEGWNLGNYKVRLEIVKGSAADKMSELLRLPSTLETERPLRR